MSQGGVEVHLKLGTFKDAPKEMLTKMMEALLKGAKCKGIYNATVEGESSGIASRFNRIKVKDATYSPFGVTVTIRVQNKEEIWKCHIKSKKATKPGAELLAKCLRWEVPKVNALWEKEAPKANVCPPTPSTQPEPPQESPSETETGMAMLQARIESHEQLEKRILLSIINKALARKEFANQPEKLLPLLVQFEKEDEQIHELLLQHTVGMKK